MWCRWSTCPSNSFADMVIVVQMKIVEVDKSWCGYGAKVTVCCTTSLLPMRRAHVGRSFRIARGSIEVDNDDLSLWARLGLRPLSLSSWVVVYSLSIAAWARVLVVSWLRHGFGIVLFGFWLILVLTFDDTVLKGRFFFWLFRIADEGRTVGR